MHIGAELRRRNDEGLVLDGARTQERFPMRLAGRKSETSRHDEYFCSGEGQASI